MQDRRLTQSRAERLIAGSRFVLALVSYGAIYIDPLEPARFPTLTYTLLAVYSVYALAAVAWSAGARGIPRIAQIASHCFDLAFFSIINFTTYGPTSPLFIFFVFSIICAMLRFGRRGTLATVAATVALFILTGVSSINGTGFELNRFVIRSAYLLVMGTLLVYLSDYHQRIQGDLSRIASWPTTPATDRDALLCELLHQLTETFGSRRVLLAFASSGERFAYLGMHDDGRFSCAQEREHTANVLLDATPDGSSLRQTFGIESFVVTPFEGQLVHGRVLLMDMLDTVLEEVNLARIAASVIATRLDHHFAAAQLQRGAAAEARIRVARDLHDSVLQSLTGVTLLLKTIPNLMARDPEEAQERLAEIEEVLVADQKDLRRFIDQLHAHAPLETPPLAERIDALCQRFSSQWQLDVQKQIAPLVHLLPSSARDEIFTIVSEAVANAAKHAAATHVNIAVTVDGTDVRIHVADDGRGFPFHGRYDLNEMIAMQRGPVTLKGRIRSLGGNMIIDSSPNGATLDIRVPLPRAV